MIKLQRHAQLLRIKYTELSILRTKKAYMTNTIFKVHGKNRSINYSKNGTKRYNLNNSLLNSNTHRVNFLPTCAFYI
jgi:hypothetical protein